MIFPFISGIDEVEDVELELTETTLEMYREVAWDYVNDTPIIENGDFKIVEGKEAIKVWIYKALKTNRFEHEIYSWDYGSELNELVGYQDTNNLIKTESERYIKEALLINPYILDVKINDVKINDSILNANVIVNTVYGEVDINV